jgi:hypothetical protein
MVPMTTELNTVDAVLVDVVCVWNVADRTIDVRSWLTNALLANHKRQGLGVEAAKIPG